MGLTLPVVTVLVLAVYLSFPWSRRRGQSTAHEYTLRIRCGEKMEGRVNLWNDPSLDTEGGKPIYFCRKVLMGSGHRHQQVEVSLKRKANRKLLERQITGGKFGDESGSGRATRPGG